MSSARTTKTLSIGVAGLVLALSAIRGSSAGAAVMEVPAHSINHSGHCWAPVFYLRLRGGEGRYCYTPNSPLSWPVRIPSGEEGVVRLYGYRDSIARGFRVRIDGGAWSEGVLSNTTSPSEHFFTSPALGAGTHYFDLEWIDSAGSFTFDYFELETTALPDVRRSTVTDAPLPPNACSIDPDDGQVAIAAAIGACPDGSTILFPPNETYHQTDKINVERRSDLVIDGNGSTFVKTSPSTGSDALGSSSTRPNWQLLENKNVTLQDMTIRGAFSDPPFPRNPNLVPGPNQYDHGIAIFGGEEITLRDLSVFNVLGEFVSIAPSGFIRGGGALAGEVPRNIHVERLHGEHAGRQCIAPTAVIGFWLTDSYLADCQQAGVDMEMDVAGEPIQDVHILRNRISDYYFSAITVPLSGKTGDVDGVEIRGNVTLTPPDTCFPTVLITYRSDGSTAADIVTEDNDLQTLSSGITYRDVASGSIRNNRIRKTAPNSLCGPSSAQTVQLVNSPNVVVSSNTAIEDGIRLVH